jgi:hypothetical protein
MDLFVPTLSLTALAGVISWFPSGLFDDGENAWTVSPSATLPIFAQGARSNVANGPGIRFAHEERKSRLASVKVRRSPGQAFQDLPYPAVLCGKSDRDTAPVNERGICFADGDAPVA